MKNQILDHIYDSFATWAGTQPTVCAKGCSTCCTDNVTITALEGERILDYVLREGKQQWFATALRSSRIPPKANLTENGYVKSIMEGLDAEEEAERTFSRCPFLVDEVCGFYPVRSFSCRSFISAHRCSPEDPAEITDEYALSCSIVTQIIEHVGQGEYWGNMIDMLLALLDNSKYRDIAELVNDPARCAESRFRLLRAEPVPGFLLDDEGYKRIEPLLAAILNHQIEGKSVNDILNGQ